LPKPAYFRKIQLFSYAKLSFLSHSENFPSGIVYQHKNPFSGKLLSRIIYQKNKFSIIFGKKIRGVKKWGPPIRML